MDFLKKMFAGIHPWHYGVCWLEIRSVSKSGVGSGPDRWPRGIPVYPAIFTRSPFHGSSRRNRSLALAMPAWLLARLLSGISTKKDEDIHSETTPVLCPTVFPTTEKDAGVHSPRSAISQTVAYKKRNIACPRVRLTRCICFSSSTYIVQNKFRY